MQDSQYSIEIIRKYCAAISVTENYYAAYKILALQASGNLRQTEYIETQAKSLLIADRKKKTPIFRKINNIEKTFIFKLFRIVLLY